MLIKKNELPLLLIIIILLFSVSPAELLSGQESDRTVNFSLSNLELVFKPPLRSGFNSENPVQVEVPRLNLIANLMSNYLLYLNRLQKIAPETVLKLMYAPDLPVDSWEDDSKVIRLKDLGLNQILLQINQHLKEKSTTESTYLLDNASSLFTIPDQLPRKTSKIAIKTELINHSFFQKSLEPDTDFCVVDEEQVITARPFKRSNRLFLMTDMNDVCSSTILLDQSKRWYANLTASTNGRFLGFTDGLLPAIINLSDKNTKRISENQSEILLDWQWSPTESIIAGFLLNNVSQERRLFIFDAEKGNELTLANYQSLTPNYYNANVQWSPDGQRILLTSAKSVHLIDMKGKRFYADIARLPNEIAELVWSFDSRSFAVVEIIGQSRNRYTFDDLDFRKSILHRFNIKDDFTATEDHAQRSESRNTIKLVSFWTQDRVLYLEGRLVSKRLNTPFWDLSRSFSAYLTPGPSTSLKRDGDSSVQPARSTLPLQYLYVFRNLDGKFKNIYDAGFNHSNHIHLDSFTNIWFIGLRRPDEILQQNIIFSHRISPYPFSENNVTVFSDSTAVKMETFLKFMADYNLRSVKFNRNISRFFMLANFSGPMNLWSGDLNKIVDGLNLRDD